MSVWYLKYLEGYGVKEKKIVPNQNCYHFLIKDWNLDHDGSENLNK